MWCVMRDLQERATVDFERTLPIIRAGWVEVEKTIETERLRVEREVSRLYEAEKFDRGGQLLTEFMAFNSQLMLETGKGLAAQI